MDFIRRKMHSRLLVRIIQRSQQQPFSQTENPFLLTRLARVFGAQERGRMGQGHERESSHSIRLSPPETVFFQAGRRMLRRFDASKIVGVISRVLPKKAPCI